MYDLYYLDGLSWAFLFFCSSKYHFNFAINKCEPGAVVLAQLVEWSLPIPEVCILNPVIGNNLYIEHLFTVNCIEKTKIKNKEAGNGQFKKINANHAGSSIRC